MIKFFRNIRQGFLSEGKTAKYFKYAIGEIILVVLGILIALGINNANEFRKDRVEEQIYLNGLYDELLRDSIYFESTDETLNTIEQSGRGVLSVLDHPNKQIIDSLQFLNNVRFMIGLDQKLPEPIIWNELQSSGNLRLIQNRKLLELLYQHYQRVQSCQKDYDDNAHTFILQGRYFDSKTFSIEDQDDFFDNWKKDIVSSPEVFNALLHNKEFYETVKGITTGMLISRKTLRDVRSSVQKPLNELRKELRRS